MFYTINSRHVTEEEKTSQIITKLICYILCYIYVLRHSRVHGAGAPRTQDESAI